MNENQANKRTFLIDDVLYETVRGGRGEGERVPVEGDRVVVTKINRSNIAPSLASVYIIQGDDAFDIDPYINGVPDLFFNDEYYDEYYVVTSAKLLADIGTGNNAEEQAETQKAEEQAKGRTSASESDNVNQPDNVDSPSHYTAGDIEVIDIIAQTVAGYDDPFVGHCVGTATKYLNRAPYKHAEPTDCLRKAAKYLAFAIEHLEKKEGE